MAQCKLTPAQMAQGLMILKNDPAQFSTWMRTAMKPGFMDKFWEFHLGTMLGPVSAIAKGVGDVTSQALELARTAGAAGLEQGISRLQGRASERSWGELAAHWEGITDTVGPLSTMARRIGASLDRIFTGSGEDIGKQLAGMTPAQAAKKIAELQRTRNLGESFMLKIGGKFGTFVRTPFRAFNEISDYFRGMSGRVQLNKEAMRLAISDAQKAGVAPAQMGQWVGARRIQIRDQVLKAIEDGDDTVHPNIQKAMLDAADRLTYTQELPPGFKELGQARNAPGLGGFMLKAILPFYNVPFNIARTTVQYTPLQLMSIIPRALKGELPGGMLADELARPLIGSIIGGTFAGAAAAGLVTGSGPSDPKARDDLQESGWLPYSFKTPDGKYLSYRRLTVIGSLIGTVADAVESRNEDTLRGAANKAMGSLSQNLLDQTFFKGLADATAYLHDPLRAGDQFLKSEEQSLVPSVIQHAASAIDPTVRETNLATAIPSVIPGLKETLPAKTTPFGEPMTRGAGESAAERFLSPFQRSSDKPEADLEREMARIDYEPPKIDDKLQIPFGSKKVQVPLTEDEKQLFIESRQRAVERARDLIASPQWDNIPDEVEGTGASKKKILETLFRQAHSIAEAQVKRNPDFVARRQEALEALRKSA